MLNKDKMCSQQKLVKLLTPKETTSLECLFKMFDVNNDGELTRDELVNSLFKFMGKIYTREEIRDAVQKFIRVTDRNKNGTIDIKEFMSYFAITFNKKDPDCELREVFAFFDEDNNNEISHAELKKAMNKLGAKYTDLEISKIMRNIDKNGDGVIYFDEFKEMMSGNHFK
ncbi:Calmodulin-like [Oopsacas minuta]|uniref:Calmodulin-like n=1 Tax=Oopsacas minuta TaxID=111878 RepID=A0AAV7JZW6_9METZ|nr:Calmodulin-like [Oopsacas minuta]